MKRLENGTKQRMADLKTFAKRIRKIGSDIEFNVSATMRKTAVVANQTVILSTPVDTGRARGNWFASVGFPITEETEEVDKSGSGIISANNSKISRQKLGETIYLSNNLSYIQKLNEGSSSQAPENFVGLAVKAAVNFIKRSKVVR